MARHPRCVGGTAVALWLRYYATNRKVAGSIPAGVSGSFIDIKSFRSHYGPGVDSVSNRNEYQEYFLEVKAAGAVLQIGRSLVRSQLVSVDLSLT